MEFALVHVVSDRASLNFPRWHNKHHPPRGARAIREWFGPHVNTIFNDLETAWIAADLRDEAATVNTDEEYAFELDLGPEYSAEYSAETFLDRIAGAAVSIRDQLQPQGDVHNDDTVSQRALNIVTSLPILALGWHLRGKMTTPEGESYANSLVAVGVAATAYHASWGKVRTSVARKLDYYAISYSSAKLIRALWPGETTKKVERVMHCVTPFRPFWVSTVGALAMQAEFVRLASKNEALRPALKAHMTAAAASGVAFATEDALSERAGFLGKHLHSVWHLASTYGLWTIGSLVKHKEQMRAFAATRSAGLYDSASSLQDLYAASHGGQKDF